MPSGSLLDPALKRLVKDAGLSSSPSTSVLVKRERGMGAVQAAIAVMASCFVQHANLLIAAVDKQQRLVFEGHRFDLGGFLILMNEQRRESYMTKRSCMTVLQMKRRVEFSKAKQTQVAAKQ